MEDNYNRSHFNMSQIDEEDSQMTTDSANTPALASPETSVIEKSGASFAALDWDSSNSASTFKLELSATPGDRSAISLKMDDGFEEGDIKDKVGSAGSFHGKEQLGVLQQDSTPVTSVFEKSGASFAALDLDSSNSASAFNLNLSATSEDCSDVSLKMDDGFEEDDIKDKVGSAESIHGKQQLGVLQQVPTPVTSVFEKQGASFAALDLDSSKSASAFKLDLSITPGDRSDVSLKTDAGFAGDDFEAKIKAIEDIHSGQQVFLLEQIAQSEFKFAQMKMEISKLQQKVADADAKTEGMAKKLEKAERINRILMEVCQERGFDLSKII